MKKRLFLHIEVIMMLSAILVSCSTKTEKITLTSLDLSKMEQGYGRPHINRSVTNAPLIIAGRTFNTGVGTHASSRIVIDLGRKPAKFIAYTGVDYDVI